MLTKVTNFIKLNNLIENNEKIVVAFSYGIDSTVLLDILIKLNYKVIIAHVNHKHRQESEIEEKDTIKLAKKLNIPYYIMHLDEDKTKNFHSDAHQKRYDFFIDIAKKENAKYIATAHHLNDNLETILLNLIKGSNLYGYAGINSHIMKDNINIVRPLLCLTKDEIKEYQKINNLKFYEDSSNSEDLFRRNRIRHNIIPNLLSENPNLLNEVKNYSNMMFESFNYIRKQSINYLKENNNFINLNSFKPLDNALKKDIISLILENNNLNRSYNLINLINNMLLNENPQNNISLSNDYVFKKRFDKAFIEKNKISNNEIYLELYENNVIFVKNTKFYFTKILPNNNVNYLKLCYNNLRFPLILRTRKNGDKIKMTYGHKKIKNLLIDLHLTTEQKNETLILENNGEILWVYNYAKSQDLISMKDKSDIYLVYEVE